MKKRLLSFVLSLVLIIATIPYASADTTPTSGSCGDRATWSLNVSTGTLTIGGTGAMDDYDNEWGWKTTPWQAYNYQITTVEVLNGITHIGDEAFGSRWSMGVLPNLKKVYLPSSLTSIGDHSFANTSLTSVALPSSLKTIGGGAFSGTRLTSVNIPASVTSIGYNKWLDEEGVSNTFYNSYELKEITVDSGNKYYSSVDGILYDKDITKLVEYPYGKPDENYTIPKTVTTPLYLQDFWWLPALKSITVPDGVKLMVNPGIDGVDGWHTVDNWKFMIYFAGEIPTDIDEWYYVTADNGIVDIEAQHSEVPGAAKITGLSPASGTKNFDITTGEEVGFYIKFDKPIASNDGQPYQAKVDLKSSGAFAIYRASDDQLVYKPSQYASFDFGLNTDKTQLGVHPVNIRTILDPATEYYITMGSDFVKFENGVTSPAIQKGEWTFTTAGEAQKSLTLSLSRSSSDITARSTAKNTATTNQADAKITWKSSNPSVATATQNGNSVTVTGVAAGNATITATATWNGQTVSANWKVTVYSNLKVSLKDKKIYLDKGQSANLVYNCSPAGGKATFQVADSSVVSVSANGKVTGLKVGTTTVQVTYVVGAGQVTDICTVQVVEDEQEKIDAFVHEAERHELQNKSQFMKSVGATSLPSEWCADFVTQCAKVCGLDDIIPTGSNPFVESKGRGVLFTDITVHNNKSFQEKYRKFFDRADLIDREAYEPQVGDIVFFRQDEKSNPNTLFSHTGIVYALDETHTHMDVVHGNWGGKVKKTPSGIDKFTYTSERDGKQHTEYVVGYLHPDWSASTGVKDGTTKVSIHCPVEVLVSYDHESLDSATEQLSASYGSMTLGSDESVSYTIDNYYDTHVTINGTGTGTMDADFTYTDDNGTVATRSFRGVPITEDTVIDVIESHDTSGGVTLIVYEGQTFREAWYANDNIAVSSPDKYATEWFSQGNEDNEENVRNFTDVSLNTWYTEAVNYVVEHGYMYGESDTTFAPLGSTLRGTVVTIIHNTEQKPTPAGGNPFSDVKDGAWYDLPIRWAVENGVAAGRGNGIFSPEMQVTREELAVFLYNFSTNYKKHAPTNFADFSQATDSAQVSSWAKTAMEWAVGNGIIHGTSTTSLTLDPKGTANRAQVAMMIKNLFENVLTE